MGWKRWSETESWILLPGTFVALTTIVIVLVAVGKHAGGVPQAPFDPSNVEHLIAHSVAGDLGNIYKGTKEEDIRRAERTQVVLGNIPGRGLALLRAST
jgi:hypothetical protein